MLFQQRGNLDFPDFLQKKIDNINYWDEISLKPEQIRPIIYDNSLFLFIFFKGTVKSKYILCV